MDSPNAIRREQGEFYVRNYQAELEKLTPEKKPAKKIRGEKQLKQPPITVDGEQYGFNADKKKCPPKKILNPLTNRCKKDVKKRTKPSKPNNWLKFLKQFKLNNPNIKGKNIMVQASKEYKKSKKSSFNLEDYNKKLDKYVEYADKKGISRKKAIEEKLFDGGECRSENKNPTKPKNKKDYYKQSILFHPDRNGDCEDSATEKFKRLNGLYRNEIDESDVSEDVHDKMKALVLLILKKIDDMNIEVENIFIDTDITNTDKSEKLSKIRDRLNKYSDEVFKDYKDELNEYYTNLIKEEIVEGLYEIELAIANLVKPPEEFRDTEDTYDLGYNDDVNDILDNLDVMSDEMENIFNADIDKS